MKIHRLAGLAAIIGAPCYVTTVRGQNVSQEDVQALVRRINELEQKVKTLEQEHNQTFGTTNAVVAQSNITNAPNAAFVTLGANGLAIRSSDSNFVMLAHGYIQGDARFYQGEKSTPDTFLLRRIRPIVEGTVWDKFDYRLMPDFGSGNVTNSTLFNNAVLDDAYINARLWPQIQIQAGKYKSPIGLERLESTADLQFVETGFATELTPNYDLGAEVHNSFFDNPVGYSIGIYNGATDGGSDDQDSDEGKDVVGRLFFQPFLRTDIAPLRRLGFGVAGSFGDHTGTPTSSGLVSYKTPGQQTMFQYAPDVYAKGAQYRLDPQAYYYWGPFGVMGEYVLSSQDIASTAVGTQTSARFNNTAWQVEGSYFLTGEQSSFKYTSLQHVVPDNNLRLDGTGWGAFEFAARVHQLSLDDDIFRKSPSAIYATSASAQEATAWGVGVNWYLNTNVKLNLDYDSTIFKGGSGAVTGHPEHVILTRMQWMF